MSWALEPECRHFCLCVFGVLNPQRLSYTKMKAMSATDAANRISVPSSQQHYCRRCPRNLKSKRAQIARFQIMQAAARSIFGFVAEVCREDVGVQVPCSTFQGSGKVVQCHLKQKAFANAP